MIKIIVIILWTILGCYGTIEFINRLIWRTGKNKIKSKAKLIIEVKDAEEYIEALIRGCYNLNISDQLFTDGHIYIRDIGSTDNTKIIISNLSKKYPDIKLLD